MYVIGTAGHVDHGKSTLVKALTGIDPDRWEEEQRREMTIDLGFAWLTLPSGRSISIVDVPGHERFIKNMLAGVGGIDTALLIIAADESVMPQTTEHLAILDLLGIEHGLVVLTKADLVDEEWLALVSEEVHDRLYSTSFANAPLVPTSARTGWGLDTLIAALDQQLNLIPPRGSEDGAPRLSIDRSFTISGFGTVVTGTLADGPLHLGDEVEILPKGLRARVRGLQTHHTKQETAFPGTRVAVNISGVSHHDLARGDVVSLPGRLHPTDLIDVQVRLVASVPRPLLQNMPLDLFVGAAEVPCRVTLLEHDELMPGESGWLQLRLAHPIALARGDRYILRQPSPSVTIGGGHVVDAHPPRHRRFRHEVIATLESLARGTPADLLRRSIADELPHEWTELIKTSGLSETIAQEGLTELVDRGEVVLLGKATLQQGAVSEPAASPLSSRWVINASGLAKLCGKLVVAVRGYHRRYPLRMGMPREELRSRLHLDGAALDALLATAASQGIIGIRETSIGLPDHRPTLDTDQERHVRQLLNAMTSTPYAPPALNLEPELFGWLVEQGKLVRVTDDVAFLPETYTEFIAWVREHVQSEGSVTVAQFRDRFGTSRKYALALLEHLDERKVTRRIGDARILY